MADPIEEVVEEDKKETSEEKRSRLLKEQALWQIYYNQASVDVLLPDGETVKGIFSSTQAMEDSMGNTQVSYGQLSLLLFIDHAKLLHEKSSILEVNQVRYKVLRIFRNSITFTATIHLSTVRT